MPVTSLLDLMVDGREYESLIEKLKVSVKVDMTAEIRKVLLEFRALRNRPAICYLANVVNEQIKIPVSIDANDDLPFAEMISAVPGHEQAVDVILVTPGGSAQQVAKFVDKLRPRFTDVTFILPYMAMSAGTIFAMSGNEIVMGPNSFIGPTDPQVPNRDGIYVPAQAILTLLDEIQKRGEQLIAQGQQPLWSDLHILRNLDVREIGNAINASKYSMELVEDYLYNFKFKNWIHHSNGTPVTDKDKRDRAKDIGLKLCSHAQWKTHSRGITRDVAWNECKIKVIRSESLPGLDKAMRRFWGMIYWMFENTPMAKAFISENYAIFRNDSSMRMKG